jgi:cysteine desulfurase
VHITIPGQDNERLLIQLESAGVLCAAGSACSASDHESSHVLRAMSLTDEEARASLRFTFGRNTTKNDVQKTADILAELTSA